jgi:two-component system chemotaxis response regulator CheB
MKKRNIIVMGASAGGMEAIKNVIAGLPADLDAAIFIVWHISPETTGILPNVLNKLTGLKATNAKDLDEIKMRHIYVAPPDRHLLLEHDHIRVTRGPKENRFRPAVDPLFRSAAYHFGRQVIGVVLSGALDDGTSGLWTIKERGGITIVQHPDDAIVADMPLNALKQVHVDYTLPAAEIGPVLAELSSEQIKEMKYLNTEENKKTEMEVRIALQENPEHPVFNLGELSPFSCPECKGVMGIIKDGNNVRYRCHTGHAFTADSLLSAITDKTENTLWNVVREMQETVMLLNHIGDHYAESNQPHEAAQYFQKAKETLEHSKHIRKLLETHEKINMDEMEAGSKMQAPESQPINKIR